MPNPIDPQVNVHQPRPVPNSRADAGTVELAPQELTKAGAFSIQGGVLTVKNEQLANLIHSKLADASKMLPAGKVASDVDVGVTVKIKS
jgi:hypothetical protein